MSEVELDGLSVMHWLNAVGHKAASEILVGCTVDNQTDDDLMVIEGIGPDNVLQCRLGHMIKRIPPAVLSRSTVFDPRPMAPLRAAVNSIKSPAQIELERARIALQECGIPPSRVSRTDDVFTLLHALNDHRSETLPSDAEQNERYEALKRTGMLSLAAKIVDRWRAMSMRQLSRIDAGILIKLAYCLRHSGDLEEALKSTAPVKQYISGVVMSSSQRSVLATERAAILMDLYELRHDRDLLVEARRCAAISWATAPSQEASLVFKRLDKHEKND